MSIERKLFNLLRETWSAARLRPGFDLTTMGCGRLNSSCVLVILTLTNLFHLIQATRLPALDQKYQCGINASWNPSVKTWNQAETDGNLGLWWNNTVAGNYGATLANQVARHFGAQQTDFSCGIDDQGSCVIPGCQAYLEAGDEP